MKTFKKIILDDMKANGLGHIVKNIKSVRYSSYAGGNSLDVVSINLFKADREKLEALLKDYELGSFDGMQDLYEYKKEPSTKERQVKYAFLRNEFTQDIKNLAAKKLKDEYDVTDDTSAQARMGVWYDTATHRILSAIDA